MQTLTGRNRFRTAAATTTSLLASAALGLVGCHDLSEQPASSITPSSYFQTTAQVQTALAGVYSGLKATQTEYWQISETSSDEVIVPTRGQNWLDQGKWVELWQHSFGPNSGAGRDIINVAYNDLSSAIAKANANIQSLQGVQQTPNVVSAVAEMRAIRAWSYFMLMDGYGGVPIVTQPQLTTSPRASRDSVARFIEAELHAVRGSLDSTLTLSQQGRITKGGVDAILSSLYLNWPVYTGTVTTSGLTPGQTRYDSVLAVTSRIINSGVYTLPSTAYDSAGWKKNFTAANPSSTENIFVVSNLAQSGLGLDFPNRTLHYNSFKNPGGWNGFSTISDIYNSFDSADARKSVFLVGPQKQLDTGAPAYLQDGVTPLNFTPTISSLNAAGEGEGIRNNKFALDPNHYQQYNGNSFTIFRIQNIYLDRAEALYQTGQSGQALTLLNTLRARVYSPPSPLTTINTSVILKERLHELFFEGKRRQDMIRLGTYDATRQFKPDVSAGYHILFPIPTLQIQSNPLLTQNPGY